MLYHRLSNDTGNPTKQEMDEILATPQPLKLRPRADDDDS